MFLPLVRTSAIALLLSLVAGHVTTATEKTGVTCRQEIPAELIRELWSRTKHLINRLPREDKSFRRLLPKFCIKCSGHVIGWLEMRELIDVYQRTVFSREAVQKLLPLYYNDLLYRLQHTLQHCVSSSKLTKPLKLIKKLERKIKKVSTYRLYYSVAAESIQGPTPDHRQHHYVPLGETGAPKGNVRGMEKPGKLNTERLRTLQLCGGSANHDVTMPPSECPMGVMGEVGCTQRTPSN
ncbi:interleukin-26 [Sphaeramia orbicularis]|uniref:interleukin-26 n=1 Tax=Sphaeramia orbicularis TaxID=375764 RepID=UPI00117C0DB7|nr:uncharacterized protein LOC115429090 [Sphaeramia orbicularis]